MEVEINPAFAYGDIVKTVLDKEPDFTLFRVVSFQINLDHQITYGCSNILGDWKWFKAYEIELVEPRPEIGFTLKLKK